LHETEHGNKFAAEVITKHFGAKELTPEWFHGRILSDSNAAFARSDPLQRVCGNGQAT
jgi:hypothetical protein